MWEAIANVLSGSNAIIAVIAVLILVLIFGFYAKTGIIAIKRKGVSVGKCSPEFERGIIRRQIEYVRAYCAGLEPQLEAIFRKRAFFTEGAQAFYFKYLAGIISNVIEDWVLHNNFSQSPNYVEMKSEELKARILAAVGKCDYDKAGFNRKVNVWVQDVIQHMSLIRKNASVSR